MSTDKTCFRQQAGLVQLNKAKSEITGTEHVLSIFSSIRCAKAFHSFHLNP